MLVEYCVDHIANQRLTRTLISVVFCEKTSTALRRTHRCSSKCYLHLFTPLRLHEPLVCRRTWTFSLLPPDQRSPPVETTRPSVESHVGHVCVCHSHSRCHALRFRMLLCSFFSSNPRLRVPDLPSRFPLSPRDGWIGGAGSDTLSVWSARRREVRTPPLAAVPVPGRGSRVWGCCLSAGSAQLSLTPQTVNMSLHTLAGSAELRGAAGGATPSRKHPEVLQCANLCPPVAPDPVYLAEAAPCEKSEKRHETAIYATNGTIYLAYALPEQTKGPWHLHLPDVSPQKADPGLELKRQVFHLIPFFFFTYAEILKS